MEDLQASHQAAAKAVIAARAADRWPCPQGGQGSVRFGRPSPFGSDRLRKQTLLIAAPQSCRKYLCWSNIRFKRSAPRRAASDTRVSRF